MGGKSETRRVLKQGIEVSNKDLAKQPTHLLEQGPQAQSGDIDFSGIVEQALRERAEREAAGLPSEEQKGLEEKALYGLGEKELKETKETPPPAPPEKSQGETKAGDIDFSGIVEKVLRAKAEREAKEAEKTAEAQPPAALSEAPTGPVTAPPTPPAPPAAAPTPPAPPAPPQAKAPETTGDELGQKDKELAETAAEPVGARQLKFDFGKEGTTLGQVENVVIPPTEVEVGEPSGKVGFNFLGQEAYQDYFNEQGAKDLSDTLVQFGGKAPHDELHDLIKKGPMTVKEAERELKDLLASTKDPAAKKAIGVLLDRLNPFFLFLNKFGKQLVADAGGGRAGKNIARERAYGYLRMLEAARKSKSVFGELDQAGVKTLFESPIDRAAYHLMGGMRGAAQQAKVQTKEDMAIFGMAARDPRQETLRVMMMHEGKPVELGVFSYGANSISGLGSISPQKVKAIQRDVARRYTGTGADADLARELVVLQECLRELSGVWAKNIAKIVKDGGVEDLTFDLAQHPDDGIYIYHNHPGGEVTPAACRADYDGTAAIISQLRAVLPNMPNILRAHTIIDEFQARQLVPDYANENKQLAENDGSRFNLGENISETQQGVDLNKNQAKRERLLQRVYQKMNAAQFKVARRKKGSGSEQDDVERLIGQSGAGKENPALTLMAMRMKNSADTVLAVYRDVNNNVLAVQEVPAAIVKAGNQALSGAMKQSMSIYGADNIVTYSGALTPEMTRGLEDLHSTGAIHDHVVCAPPQINGGEMARVQKRWTQVADHSKAAREAAKVSDQTTFNSLVSYLRDNLSQNSAEAERQKKWLRGDARKTIEHLQYADADS